MKLYLKSRNDRFDASAEYGNSTDGPSSWKDENGKELKAILAEIKE
jgi:hypothetical protein